MHRLVVMQRCLWVFGFLLFAGTQTAVIGQGFSDSASRPVKRLDGFQSVTSSQQTPPSLQAASSQNGRSSFVRASREKLPRESGQEYREYDLRPYTGYLTKQDHPEKAIVDWIIRETGTDVWHTSPFGFFSASRDHLLVYHTPEMQGVVKNVVDRFVAGKTDPQVIGLRVMTVGHPNWRSRVHHLMQHVSVQSPGVQAWLLTKENAAVVASMLKQRSDARQLQVVDLMMHNGQSKKLVQTRGRNYVRNIRPAKTGWPPYEPETSKVQEGYSLDVSTLLSKDEQSIDCVVQANIDQVDKLLPVALELPLPNGQKHRAEIHVPQVVSWRLHERFRWPTDRVLLLSCGVVASPDREKKGIPLLNLGMFSGTTPGRADALMFIEFRGRASENLVNTPQVAELPGSPSGQYTRSRY